MSSVRDFVSGHDTGTYDIWINAAVATVNVEKSVHTVLCRNNSADNSPLLYEKSLAQQIHSLVHQPDLDAVLARNSLTQRTHKTVFAEVSVLQTAFTFTAGDGFVETLCNRHKLLLEAHRRQKNHAGCGRAAAA